MLPHNPNQGSTANDAPPQVYKGAQPAGLPHTCCTREHSLQCSPANPIHGSTANGAPQSAQGSTASWAPGALQGSTVHACSPTSSTREHSPCVLPHIMHKGAQPAVLLVYCHKRAHPSVLHTALQGSTAYSASHTPGAIGASAVSHARANPFETSLGCHLQPRCKGVRWYLPRPLAKGNR